MKRRVVLMLLTVILLLTAAAFAGCRTLTPEEGYELLTEAYDNSVEKWGGIYLYEEKITQKATPDAAGYIKDSVVNVHCYHDGENYHPDQDYAVTITDSYYMSQTDDGGKETTELTGSNSVVAGASERDGASRDAIFVTKSQNGTRDEKAVKSDISAKEFTQSAWFEDNYSLISKLSVLSDLTEDDILFVDTSDAPGGAQTQFMTTKLTFKVTQTYLDRHPGSVLDGNYVSVQIVNVNLSGEPDYRISSIYVYKTETLAGLNLAYESYLLNISYLGPNISVPDADEKNSDGSKVWLEREDLWDGERIAADALYVPDYIG